MGFSVKCYSPVISSACCYIVQFFKCLLFPEKILLSVWRVFVKNFSIVNFICFPKIG